MVNHTYFPKYSNAQYDQFWIHENMVNSLLSQIIPEFIPTNISNKGISDQISQVFPEFHKKCGKDMSLIFGINAVESPNMVPFKMTQDRGFVVGDQDSVILKLDMIADKCNDKFNTTLISLQMNIEVELNLTMQEVTIFPVVEQIKLSNQKIVEDNVGMYVHNYANIFQAVANDQVH